MKFTEILQKVKRKLGYFILEEGTPEKLSARFVIRLRPVFQEFSPQPNDPLIQNRRLLPVKTIHGCFVVVACSARSYRPFIMLSILHEIKA
jgi:hypothetical protein